MIKFLIGSATLMITSLALANCNISIPESKTLKASGMLTEQVLEETKEVKMHNQRIDILSKNLQAKGYSVVTDERQADLSASINLREGIGLLKQLSGSYHGYNTNDSTILVIASNTVRFEKENSGHSISSFKNLVRKIPRCVR